MPFCIRAFTTSATRSAIRLASSAHNDRLGQLNRRAQPFRAQPRRPWPSDGRVPALRFIAASERWRPPSPPGKCLVERQLAGPAPTVIAALADCLLRSFAVIAFLAWRSGRLLSAGQRCFFDRGPGQALQPQPLQLLRLQPQRLASSSALYASALLRVRVLRVLWLPPRRGGVHVLLRVPFLRPHASAASSVSRAFAACKRLHPTLHFGVRNACRALRRIGLRRPCSYRRRTLLPQASEPQHACAWFPPRRSWSGRG